MKEKSILIYDVLKQVKSNPATPFKYDAIIRGKLQTLDRDKNSHHLILKDGDKKLRSYYDIIHHIMVNYGHDIDG